MPNSNKKDSDYIELQDSEKKEIEKRVTIGAVVVHEAIRQEGEEELERHSMGLLWSGLAAGLSMGFSYLVSVLIDTYLPGNMAWHPLIYSVGYTTGFIIVIMGRQQLFTENTLTAVLPLLYHRNISRLLNLFRLWGIVLAANLAGVCIFAIFMRYGDFLGPQFRQSMLDIALKAEQAGFWSTVSGGIIAGWLIALVVWLLPVAETSRLWIILLITYAVGLGNFPHVIAGSTESIYLVLVGISSVPKYILGYLLPSLLGNILGGVILVATLNHAQAMAGRRK